MVALMLRCYYGLGCRLPGLLLLAIAVAAGSVAGVQVWQATPQAIPVATPLSKTVYYEAADPRVDKALATLLPDQFAAGKRLLLILQQHDVLGEGVKLDVVQQDGMRHLRADGQVLCDYPAWARALDALQRQLPLARLAEIQVQQDEGQLDRYRFRYRLLVPLMGAAP